MKVIWRYPLAMEDEQTVEAPLAARWLSVQDQGGALTAWALVDDGFMKIPYRFLIVGTGNYGPDPTGARFLGTIQQPPFVWHVFVDSPR